MQGIDAVFPTNVDIPPKGKNAIVGLRKVHAYGSSSSVVIVLLIVGICSDKRQLPGCSKGHSNCDVLCFGSAWIERRTIVVLWLPILRVFIPIEACSRRRGINVEIVT